jgi:hypothetical protein
LTALGSGGKDWACAAATPHSTDDDTTRDAIAFLNESFVIIPAPLLLLMG